MDEITDDTREAFEALKLRAAAQEEVQREYLKEINDLQHKLVESRRQADRVPLLLEEYKAVREELGLYRAIVKGWPKGRKLVKRLTRDPDSD